jgi:hypothetical protein
MGPMASQTISATEVPYEGQLVADWLVNGKPELGWRGDPRLELRLGILTAAKHGRRNGRYFRKGDVVAYRYEVWRHNEDGTDAEILHRAAKDWHEIIPALVQLDPRTPGFKDTMTTLTAHNDKVDAERGQAIRDAHGEMTEHLWKLYADRNFGRTTFRGMPGRNPDKQA